MIRILTDSASSISPALAEKLGLDMVSLFIRYDGSEHLESEMDIDRFYDTLAERIDDIPTSSQPSQDKIEAILEDAARSGDSVVGIFISADLSGTYEGVIRAARMVKSRNLDFTCVLIDSTSAGYDEAFPVFDALDARNAGADIEVVAASAENAISCSRILFIPDSLEFLRAGGRIGGAAALLGSLIQIVPILCVEDGKATTFSKVRTLKKAVETMVKTFKEDVAAHGLKRIVVHYIGKKTSRLEALRCQIEDIVGHAVDIIPVSPVIGSHVGPAIGIAYECTSAIEKKLTNDHRELIFTV